MISKRVLRYAAVSWVFTVVVACSLGEVDFENKACPCGPGYVCDASRNVCVVPGSIDASASTSDGGIIATDAAGDTSTPTACLGDHCPCAGDNDCKDPDRRRCSSAKVCVECLPEADTCRAGAYCNAANQCVLGCKQESDCQISPAAPHCDTKRHQCVVCRTLADCVDADQCSPSGECVQGCDVDAGKLCPGGKQCCQGLCIDTQKDPLNCGGCGVACSTANGTPTCTSAVCTWSCASGYDHCTTTNSGCESNLRSDPARCGSCTTDCSTLVVNANDVSCNAGQCGYGSCKPNFDDCDGKADSGCECACGGQNQKCCPGGVCSYGSCKGSNKCL